MVRPSTYRQQQQRSIMIQRGGIYKILFFECGPRGGDLNFFSF